MEQCKISCRRVTGFANAREATRSKVSEGFPSRFDMTQLVLLSSIDSRARPDPEKYKRSRMFGLGRTIWRRHGPGRQPVRLSLPRFL